MLEQSDAEENRGVAIMSLKLALSQEAQASLAAVRVAQESAQRRARQQTMQTRLGVALLLGAAALAAVAAGPRVAHWRRSRTQPAKSAPNSPIAPEPAALATTVPAGRQAIAAVPAVVVQPAVAKPARVKATDSGVPAEGCDTSTHSGLWRRSPEACARAFAADPKNASLALAVAQSEHAHARFDEAAQWAKRALALDPQAAEAYVIIARADTENGRDDEARTAYRRYLEIAPRGWHRAEARAALRRASNSPR